MDTSKEYIKMCENWDLQTDREAQVGDYYAFSIRSGKDGEPFVVLKEYDYDPNYYTWLPRQDQLQKMVEVNPIDRLNGWLGETFVPNKNYANILVSKYDTYEKSWLAFVMKEKHNKTWDGNKWV